MVSNVLPVAWGLGADLANTEVFLHALGGLQVPEHYLQVGAPLPARRVLHISLCAGLRYPGVEYGALFVSHNASPGDEVTTVTTISKCVPVFVCLDTTLRCGLRSAS